MNMLSGSRRGTTKVLLLIALASALTGFWSAVPGAMTSAQSTEATPAPATPQPSPEESSPEAAWRIALAQTPQPRKGCFETTYPSRDWQEIPCVTPPPFPQEPRVRPRPPLTVGNGNDVAAVVAAGFLVSTAIGTFDSVSGVTSESGPIPTSTGPGAVTPNVYSLQLNTNFFASTACSGALTPAACQGWEQFLFTNNGSSGNLSIQYWLLNYNATCPTGGWIAFGAHCYRNSIGSTPVPNQPITNLGNLSLSGSVSASGDSATLSTGTTVYSMTGDDSVNAAAGWRITEYNVVGNAWSSQASFNSGSTIVPRVRLVYGGTAAPTCMATGFTGETNNLNFGPTAPAASAPGPALLFRESSAGGATSNCAAATGVGDTHLTTFGGLLYDFQASGDFVLAQRDSDIVVQTRQVSGAPTWPDASVNSAVATRMGKTEVAVCLGETPLNIDGTNTDLGDGEALALPDGVDVTRIGNVYYIVGESGDSVRAVVKASYIDVSVGLGIWPATVSGLLANANEDVNTIAASDGTVLTSPFAFEELYHPYADSWRVKPGESLLTVCGEVKEEGIPTKPFYADDLEPEIAERARGACVQAGVQEGPLLDACILDVAVIGDESAAQVYVGAPDPVAVGEVV